MSKENANGLDRLLNNYYTKAHQDTGASIAGSQTSRTDLVTVSIQTNFPSQAVGKDARIYPDLSREYA